MCVCVPRMYVCMCVWVCAHTQRTYAPNALNAHPTHPTHPTHLCVCVRARAIDAKTLWPTVTQLSGVNLTYICTNVLNAIQCDLIRSMCEILCGVNQYTRSVK